MAVFWDATMCTMVDKDQQFRGAHYLHHQCNLISLMMEAVSSSETLVNIYQTIQYNNPEDSHLIPI
jgi:hypothetical protein